MRVTLHLVFVLHQPVGVPRRRMAELAERVYEPLVDLLESHDEEVQCALHVSGYVLEWLDGHRRVLADRIAALASDGVVEMLGGGFYAPLLPIIPWRDGLGQLEMAAGYLERRMGVRPTGVWLTDGVWEPRMAELLADAGASWTMVHESIVADAGAESPIMGHYCTEHLGRPLIVLPIDSALQGLMPKLPAPSLVDALRQRAQSLGDELTLTWCGAPDELGVDRLPALFAALAAARPWLVVQHPSKTLQQRRPRRTVYLRPTTALGRPLAQQHFTRYTEAAWIHKRMIDVSKRFAALHRILRNDGYKGLSKMTQPRRALFRGQAATLYEQGGAIYAPEVRDGVYRNLIECEAQTHQLISGDGPFLETSLRDLYGDLETSALLRNQHLRMVLQPHAGGTIAAFEHSPSRSALHNTMTRRREHWHGTEIDDDAFDGHTRAWLHDRFLAPDATCERWLNDAAERGNLLHKRYRMAGLDQSGRGEDERVVVAMAGDGRVTTSGGSVPVSVIKRVGLGARDSHATVDYTVELARPLDEDIDFGCELNWATMHWLGDVDIAIDGVGKGPTDPWAIAAAPTASMVAMHHEGLGVWVFARSAEAMRVERAPIVTMDPSKARLKHTLQGVAVLLRRRIPAGETRMKWSLRLGVSPIAETDA